MTVISAIFISILGATIGSFLSVIIHRTRTKKKGILFSRSICPHCKKKIKWQHLVPIFSWLFLRGRCAYCQSKISPHYFFLELISALVFLLTFINFNFIDAKLLVGSEFIHYSINGQLLEQFIFYIIMATMLLAIFFYDALYQEIPDRFSLPAIAIAFAGGIILGSPSIINMLIGGIGLGSFFLLQFLISNGTWVGGGDIRLGALMGVLLGWEVGLVAIIISYFTGATFAIYLLSNSKAGRKSQIAFGPFLVIGTLISIWYGADILNYYLSSILI